jgi:hypothetical protein
MQSQWAREESAGEGLDNDAKEVTKKAKARDSPKTALLGEGEGSAVMRDSIMAGNFFSN